jgi:8-oxo-dGTP pyrophosphatase MutT (NUDIX family)
MRHPALLAVLADREHVAEERATWQRPLLLRSYVGATELPDELITSIRVIVLVGNDVVVCTNADGASHAWPGGRREPRESHAETACREVREETGWILDAETIEPLGFLHVFNEGDALPPYPYPDVLQLVVTARAVERAAQDWTDTEGFEISSRLVDLADACDAIEDESLCVPFVELLRARA